jgi:Ca-activated chloride channel family protein
MSFATPALLWGLLLIPVVLVAYLLIQRRRSKYAARFTNLDLLTNVVDASPGRRRHLPPALAILALAALLLAMARPQTVAAVPREESSVVLAMDSSSSMTATDVAPTRLAAAQSAASNFLDDLPDRFKVGLVSFASSATVVEEPTDDRESVRSALNELHADLGTALGDAILRSVELAPKTSANSKTGDEPTFSVLLLSDGANTQGSDPQKAIEAAK